MYLLRDGGILDKEFDLKYYWKTNERGEKKSSEQKEIIHEKEYVTGYMQIYNFLHDRLRWVRVDLHVQQPLST